MQVKIITKTEDFCNLENDWNKVEQEDNDATYYNTFDYNWKWWSAYKNDEDKNLFIIVFYDNKIPICIAPFMVISRKKMILSYRTVMFLGTGDYLNVLVNKNYKNINACMKEIFKILNEEQYKIDRVVLTNIKSDSAIANYILKSDKYNSNFSYLTECPRFYPDKFNCFDEYIKTRFKPSDVKYYVNRLQKDVGYKFNIINNKNDYNIFGKLVELHKFEKDYLIKYKNRHERRSLFEEDQRNLFIKTVYEDNESIITFTIEDNDKNILIYYSCYIHGSTLYFWNTAYNPKYEKYDLTKILNYEVFRYIFENKLSYNFDYGAGRYPWKFKWTSDFIFNYKLDMWNDKTKKGRFLKRLYKIKDKL
ncbi:hypothetical protein LF65_01182 [Clostridium beijerinckii]|uniref:BioF2-like acetyltransferase domain-containing protein n=1 Tax=Clostridium beijerinckii TaxID=1520 RepID=A0A0B5QHU9_CLOBE|nr:GNAT family N-acetyltransferase [Clostridium beijerinckii]AJG97796.1 hypothetical protein LF65_01182 [Clostridium beijerinckii]